jgi:hypothetical protein
MESFLIADGTPFTLCEEYERKTYLEVFENRDPRMAETICFPGFKRTTESTSELPSIKFGGYRQIKYFANDEALRGGWNQDYTSLPIFRLGEIMLIYAEAKAELGTLMQADLDILPSPDDTTPIEHLSEEEKKNLSYYYLKTPDGDGRRFLPERGEKGICLFYCLREESAQFYRSPVLLPAHTQAAVVTQYTTEASLCLEISFA